MLVQKPAQKQAESKQQTKNKANFKTSFFHYRLGFAEEKYGPAK